MTQEFDFGDLDEKPKREEHVSKPTPPAVDVDKLLTDIMKKVDKQIESKVKGGITQADVERISKFTTLSTIKQEVDKLGLQFDSWMKLTEEKFTKQISTYQQNAGELWAEIYPVLVKMWGASNGIGKKVAMLDALLRR